LSNSNTPAYTWQKVVGGQEPSNGTEIHNTNLAAALQIKMDFSIKELNCFGEDFYYDSYIKVDNTYYTPAGTCRKCHHRQYHTRNNAAANHLRHSLKKCGFITKQLPKTGVRKIKEMKIKNTLDEHEIESIHDRAVLDRDNSCDNSASRPDFQVQHAHQELVTICVEVDEHQHKTYTDTCELVRLNNIVISHQFRRPLVILRYNPDAFTVGDERITCKQLPRKDKEAILLRELKDVMRAAEFPESFPALLKVIKIGYDCECVSTTECGFVHSTNYPDQESIRQTYSQLQ